MIGLFAKIGFGIVDAINNAFDPYDEFSRPYLPPESNISLRAKENQLSHQLLTDFMAADLILYNKPESWEGSDYGDQALWQGIFAMTMAIKGMTEETKENLTASVIAINGMRWQEMHSVCCMKPHMIRGVDPRDMTRWADDCSNDSLTGRLAGAEWGARTKYKEVAIAILRNLADELIAHDYALVSPATGKVTTYGKLINGILTDPLRASLAMAVFCAAGAQTGEPYYWQHYHRLVGRFGGLLEFADFKFLDYTKTYDAHRAAIHLSILAKDPGVRKRCVNGLARIWKLRRKTRDPWLAALINEHWPIPAGDMEGVINRLREYPVGSKPPVKFVMNSNQEYWARHAIKFKYVNGTVRASQPLPYHALPTQDFWPQRHPYMCDGGTGGGEWVRHNGLDFLAPYWMLRNQGVIDVGD